ncbi:hypothetical protein [Armatimonas rosea]|uniref:Uncharacterized protein n=1 Tax=Armatimonas rosea TaxID=685828 RepID=A0A7W9W3R0_ARMRO|nr:hypothetical protein [Armatimonas rosea]MBB6048679.1 hypothetical protein [Armatimonas rosea]
MEIVVHRINTIEGLKSVPTHFGAEIDLRARGSELYLHHDAFREREADAFVDYLETYRHGLLVLNIKEAGIETEVLRLVRERGIERYFLLDVEFPYLYRASRQGERAIAVRYSEDESIETALAYKERVDWVWIDSNTRLPLDETVKTQLSGLKTCLVCPERWGRPQDIPAYKFQLAMLDFRLDAVMTSLACAPLWQA